MTEIVTSVTPTQIIPEGTLLKLLTYLGAKGVATDEQKLALGFPIAERTGGFKSWTLSSTLKSDQIALAEKGMQASNSGTLYSYVLGDVGFNKGKHAWRTTIIQTDISGQWILIGVAGRKMFTDNSSYGDPTLFGVTSLSNVYRGGRSIGTSGLAFRSGTVVDCLLDIEGQSLSYSVQGGTTAQISPLAPPPEPTGEYAPHFILWQANSLRVEPIPVSKYGKF